MAQNQSKCQIIAGRLPQLSVAVPGKQLYTGDMESITRNVGDLTQTERQVYETLLGHELRTGQKVVIQVMNVTAGDQEAVEKVSVDQTPADAEIERNGIQVALPDWCAVFEGLSDPEIDEVEKSILSRCTSTRNIDLDF